MYTHIIRINGDIEMRVIGTDKFAIRVGRSHCLDGSELKVSRLIHRGGIYPDEKVIYYRRVRLRK